MLTRDQMHEKLQPFLAVIDRLSARWDDEKDYEDFSDYSMAMQTHMPEGFELVRATKRPFGCVITTPLGTKLKVYATAKQIVTRDA